MKTANIFILLLFSLSCYSQKLLDPHIYSIAARGEAWLELEKPDSVLSFAAELLRKKSSDFERRQALYLIGRASLDLRLPNDAVSPLLKCISLSKNKKDDILLLRSMITISGAYISLSEPDFESATLYLNNSLKLAEELKDTSGLCKVYTNYSVLSQIGEDYEAAINYNRLCEALLSNTTSLKKERAINLYEKANTLMELFFQNDRKELLKEARESYQLAVALFQQIGRKKYEALARNQLGNCLLYFEDEDFGQAGKEMRQSINLGEEIKDTLVMLYGYYALANLHEMNADAKNSIDVLVNLRNLLEQTGAESDYAFMLEQFGNTASKASLALINSKISIFKKQLENQQITRDKQLFGLAVVFLSLGLIAFFAYYRQKKKLMQNEIDNLTKTREIEFIKARLDGEEKSRIRIAQQIHDGVGGLLVSTRWNLESAMEELPESEKKVSDRLRYNLRLQENSYQELRRVMYELEGRDTDWWETLHQFCQQLAESKNVKIRFYTYNLDEQSKGQLGEEIRLIIQELVTNSLKHAQATELSIQISQIEKELDIIVEDNGVGFDKQRVAKGIGLRSIEARVSKLGGTTSTETGKGKGTITFIDLPLKKLQGQKRAAQAYASAN